MMFIEVTDLVKEYETGNTKFTALDKASFGIESGQIVTILGPSGSGKSTLLNIIGGMDIPSSGKVEVAGQRIEKYNMDQLTEYRRENIGFIFQFYNLIPSLTVYENIQTIENICKDSLDIDDMLKAVQMYEHKDKFPKELSGGQQQRVSIARALIKKPNILLCDEPTGALDYKTSKEILKVIEDVNKKFNTTIIIITHNEAIANMSHRIIHLRSGVITKNISNVNIVSAEAIEW